MLTCFYNSENEKNGIGFFKFPREQSRNRTWKRFINQYRRKGTGDTFNIKPCTVVCEFHFKADGIKVSLGRGKKTLKPGAVPSVFSFKRKASPPQRKSPKKRLISFSRRKKLATQNEEYDDKDREMNILKKQIDILKKEN